VTLELGPETELERIAKLTREVVQERFILLDRTLLVRAKEGVLAITSDHEANHRRHALHMGRLKTLERMGLANEKRPGVWQLDPDLHGKLRRLGERADKIKMMQRALKEAGLDRALPLTPCSIGLDGNLCSVRSWASAVDEITDRHYVVIDGADAGCIMSSWGA
jgi:type IV secretory pathway VirD2 relaxase